MRALRVSAFISVLLLAALSGCIRSPSDGDSNSPTETPGASREPKNLAERLVLNMDEEGSSFFFAEPGGPAGGPFRLPAGRIVGIHLVNLGLEEHEFVAGRGVAHVSGESGPVPDGYNESLFASLPADVFVYKPQKVEVATEGGIGELEAESGADLWVRTTFPESMKGVWEIGCFKPGHYEAGMKATLIVE